MQCIKNKLPELDVICDLHKFDVLCVSEHWMTDRELDFYSAVHNLKLVTSFCRARPCGGVAVYLRDTFAFSVLDLSCFSEEINAEFAGIMLNDLSLIIITMYRSPSGDINRFFCLLELCLTYLISLGVSIVIGTDHNINLLQNNGNTLEFLNLLRSFNVYNCVSEPTRGESCLDSFLTNVNCWDYKVEVSRDQISDHKYIMLSLDTYCVNKVTPCQTRMISFRCLNDYNIFLFCESLEVKIVHWMQSIVGLTANVAFGKFFHALKNEFDTFFPVKHKRSNVKHRSTAMAVKASNWFTPDLEHMRKVIVNINDLAKSRPVLLPYLRRLRKSYRIKIKEAKQCAIAEHVAHSSNPCKATWDIINKNRSSSSHEVSGDFATADSFNEYFLGSVDTLIDDVSAETNYLDVQGMVPLAQSNFTWSPVNSSNVIDIVNNFKSTKSRDIYDMSAVFLKRIITIMAPTLTYLFNLCLEEGTFPDVLKLNKTVPIFKKGPKDSVSSYRPVSLIPVLGKILEAIMLEQLYEYFESHQLLAPAQFGFRKGRSTVSAVDFLLQEVLRSFESRQSLSVMLCDLSRAFDCVSHDILLMKLERYGVDAGALRVLRSYLTNRRQVVCWQGKTSGPLPVRYGVPQGSIIGPFLFVVSINDLCISLNDNILLYADDTTLFARDKDRKVAYNIVSNLKDRSTEWFVANKLTLNEAKTQSVTFSLGLPRSGEINGPVKLLGFVLDPQLCWSDHVNSLCTRLSRVIFLLRRLKADMPLEFVKLAFHAFFQSHILYGTRLWGHSSNVIKILRLQKKAVRMLSDAHVLDHCKPLFKQHAILTVYNIYIYQCLVEIKNNLISFPTNDDVHAHLTRRHSDLHIIRNRLNKVSNCFPVTGVRFYNALPGMVRGLSLAKFSKVVKDWLLQNPLYALTDFFGADKSGMIPIQN